MKIEFLATGSQDCPLIRIYNFDSFGACQLKEALQELVDGLADYVTLNDLQGVEGVDGCRVTARKEENDQGVLVGDKDSHSFFWILFAK